jgi:hypothetical protein
VQCLGRAHDATAARDLMEYPEAAGIDFHTAELTWMLRRLYLPFMDGGRDHRDMRTFPTGV